MWRGLYTAATGMITETQRTDVIANNLANAATAGYKRDVAVHREFENMLIQRVNDHENAGESVGMQTGGPPALARLEMNSTDVTRIKKFDANPTYRPNIGQLGLGDYIDEISVDHAQGALQSTGNTFDLAIAGEGFFAVDTPNGVRYTRNGAFVKNQNGVLQDLRGNNLLDRGGNPITIPQNIPQERIGVTSNGSIFVNDQPTAQPRQIAQIQVVQFDNRLALAKEGNNLFYAVTDNDGDVAQPAPATGEVLQGVLEKANTEIVREMVELIHNHRLYEAGAKAVATQDTMLEASVNQLGRIGG